mgnify:FL=1
MNLRSTILQTGALAFCVSIIILSLTGYTVLEIIIISFIIFTVVTLLATLFVSVFFPPTKENEKREEVHLAVDGVKMDEMKHEGNLNVKGELKDKKDESLRPETASKTEKE